MIQNPIENMSSLKIKFNQYHFVNYSFVRLPYMMTIIDQKTKSMVVLFRYLIRSHSNECEYPENECDSQEYNSNRRPLIQIYASREK